jgi:copper chaperone
MERLVMDIQGMSCGHCVGAVKRALTAIDGTTVDSLTVGSAEVHYDPAKTDERTILIAVDAAGYPARAVVVAS